MEPIIERLIAVGEGRAEPEPVPKMELPVRLRPLNREGLRFGFHTYLRNKGYRFVSPGWYKLGQELITTGEAVCRELARV